MDLYLGIDGGQTSTQALVGDSDGKVLGRGFAGPCNHVGADLGRSRLTEALERAVGDALLQAGGRWDETRFAGACFGMSGGPDDKREIIAELISADALEVTTDAHIALYGATGGEPGIIVIAGTGSIALGRDETRKVVRAGGWGYVFGDEGGAFDIVRRSLRAALRFEEGWGEPTELHGALLAETGASSTNELLHWFYHDEWPRSRVAALAPLVGSTAIEGDYMARGVLRQAGEALAELVAGVRGQLAGDEEYPVAAIGGVFDESEVFENFKSLVQRDGDCRLVEPRTDPATGALLRAIEIAHR